VSVGDDQLDAAQPAAGELRSAVHHRPDPPLATGQHDVAMSGPRRAIPIRLVCASDFCTKAAMATLGCDARSGVEVGVKYEPNVSSGGQISYTDIGKFLRDSANGRAPGAT
jgi:hypothetical protein